MRPVLADEEVPRGCPRHGPVHQGDGARVDELLEQAGLDEPHQRLGAEHADGEVHAVEHDGENRQAGQRLADEPSETLLDARGGSPAIAAILDRQVVREARVVAAVGRIERRHRRAPDGVAKLGDAAPLGGHRLDHRNAQARRQPRGVDDDAVHPGFVDHVQHEHHGPADGRQLRGEHQGAPEVPGVRYLDDDVGLPGVEDSPRDEFVLRESSFERRDAGRVDEFADFPAQHDAPGGERHRRAGVVRDDGILPGQAAEQDALADVGIADERDAAWAGPKSQDRVGCRFANRSLGAGHPVPLTPARERRCRTGRSPLY